MDARHAGRLKELPIWIHHGALDTVAPIEFADNLAAALRTAGAIDLHYLRDGDVAHDEPTDDRFVELFAWLEGRGLVHPSKRG